MQQRDSNGVDPDATVGRSWKHLEDAEALLRCEDSSAIDRSRFGFRARRSSDATSLQSAGMAPFSCDRFTGFQHSHHGSGQEGEDEDDHQEEEFEEEEEEEEEDDDDVRRSWTREKEPVHRRLTSEIDLASFRFRSEHYGAEDKDQVEEEGEEDREEDGDSDASFASLEWVTRQLRQLERRKHGAAADAEVESQEEEDATDGMDPSVRQALSLLNGGGEAQRVDGGEEGAWARSAAERRGSYFDIVQEAMAVEWRRGDESEEEEQDQQSDGEEEEEQDNQPKTTEEETVDVTDEWLEAYTAKGRVYYYNRRTRESSWTRPEGLANAHDAHDEMVQNQEEHEQHEEEEEEGHKPEVKSPQQEQSKLSHDDHSDHHSGQSSTSSTSSSKQTQDRESKMSQKTLSLSNVLFCCFCGSQLAGTSGFQSHLATCNTRRHHQQTASALYTQFQHMLVLLSEDVSLRSLHYASSFPDAKPHPIGVEPPSQTQQSVRESLALLRVKHRSSRKPSVHRTADVDDRVPAFQPAQRLSLPSNGSSKKPPKEPLANRYTSLKQKPTPVALLNVETCRHCQRSFAEGRLAKHEAVCPRVFGNENAWGRGPNPSVQKPSITNEPTHPHHQDMLRSLKKKHNTASHLKHTLALSFQEHQASLVECPCCRRKFAPSGAQQHIDICKTVQHRPRNPVPLLKDFALAG